MNTKMQEAMVSVQPRLIEPYSEIVKTYHLEPDRIKAREDLARNLQVLLIESGLPEHKLMFQYHIIRNSVFLKIVEDPYV